MTITLGLEYTKFYLLLIPALPNLGGEKPLTEPINDFIRKCHSYDHII